MMHATFLAANQNVLATYPVSQNALISTHTPTLLPHLNKVAFRTKYTNPNIQQQQQQSKKKSIRLNFVFKIW